MACNIEKEVKSLLGDASQEEIASAVQAAKEYIAQDKKIDSDINEDKARSVLGSASEDAAYFKRLEAAIAANGTEVDGLTYLPGESATVNLLDGALGGRLINQIIRDYTELGLMIPEDYAGYAINFLEKIKTIVASTGAAEFSHNFTVFNSQDEHSRAFWVNKGGVDANGNIDGGQIIIVNGKTDRPISITGELMYHEIIHSATEAGLDADTKLLRHVSRIQREVMKQLTADMLLAHLEDPTKAEKERAQEILRYMNGDPSEFLAYSISNPNVYQAIANMRIKIDTFKIDKSDSNAYTSTLDKVKEIFNDIISVTQNGPTAATALNGKINDILVRNINAKAKLYDGDTFDVFNEYDQFITGGRLGKIDEFMKEGSSKIGDKLDQLMESSATTRAGLNNFLDSVSEIQGIRQLRDTGVMQSIMHTVFRTTTSREFAGLFQIIRKVKSDNDKEQNTLKEANANLVNSWFKGISNEVRLAVTDLMAVDPGALNMDRIQLAELFESDVVLDAKINQLVSEIGVNEYLNQARDLGWYMIHGEAKNRVLQTNAHRIYYRMWNGEKNIPLPHSEDITPEEMIKKIDQLTSLFAIKFVDKRNKKLVSELMKDENAIAMSLDNTNQEGLHVVDLAMQHYASSRAEELRQFRSYANVLDKGWLRKAYKREKKARVVPEDLLLSMVERGWGEKGKLNGGAQYSEAATEMRNDGKKYYIMFASDYSASRTQGAIHDVGYFDQVQQMKDIYEEGQDGFEENIELVKDHRATLHKDSVISSQFRHMNTDEMMARSDNLMAVMKIDGTIVDYSVPISRSAAEQHMDLDRDIASVLAATVTHRSAKVKSIMNNAAVVNKLLGDEKEHAGKDGYITLTRDGEYSKQYAMIPEYTRDYIFNARKRFGLEGNPHSIVVHKDMLDDLIGYKDYSIANEFKLGENGKYFDMKNHPEMALQVERLEYFLKKIMSRYKTVLVILNPETIIGNAWSNFAVASIHGIDPKTYVRKFKDHWQNIEDYNEVHNEMIKLISERDAGFSGLDNRIAGLKRRLEVNPMHELMKDGQFNMIIEDIDTHDNKEDHVEYHKRVLLEKIIGAKGGKTATDIAENGLLTKNSNSFKVIEKLTAYNDLINRMIVKEKFEYELEKERSSGSGMTDEEYATRKQDILNYVDQLFVNYSYLDNRYIKYANDVGLVLFTKYFFRSMKTLKQVYDKNPLALTAFLGIDNFVYDAVSDPWEGVFKMDEKLDTKIGPTAQFDIWKVMEKVFLPAPINMF